MSLELCPCQDRNNSGTIETSKDLNDDGIISLTPLGQKFLGYDDECVLWTVPVGANDSNARAMAIDANGYLWVGDWQGQRFFKLDPADGRLVNPTDPSQSAPAGGYGITIDRRNRVWLASYSDDLGGGTVARYSPDTPGTDWPSRPV